MSLSPKQILASFDKLFIKTFDRVPSSEILIEWISSWIFFKNFSSDSNVQKTGQTLPSTRQFQPHIGNCMRNKMNIRPHSQCFLHWPSKQSRGVGWRLFWSVCWWHSNGTEAGKEEGSPFQTSKALFTWEENMRNRVRVSGAWSLYPACHGRTWEEQAKGLLLLPLHPILFFLQYEPWQKVLSLTWRPGKASPIKNENKYSVTVCSELGILISLCMAFTSQASVCKEDPPTFSESENTWR